MTVPFTDGREDEALIDVVGRIPSTWSCMECKRTFPNNPDGEPPFAVRIMTDERGVRMKAGDICKRCYDHHD